MQNHSTVLHSVRNCAKNMSFNTFNWTGQQLDNAIIWCKCNNLWLRQLGKNR